MNSFMNVKKCDTFDVLEMLWDDPLSASYSFSQLYDCSDKALNYHQTYGV